MAIVTKSPGARLVTPYLRVITDNDYAGDPDGLVQLVHLLLSPSVEVRAVIGSHLGASGPFNTSGRSAAEAKVQVDEIVGLLGLTGRIRTFQGSNLPSPIGRPLFALPALRQSSRRRCANPTSLSA